MTAAEAVAGGADKGNANAAFDVVSNGAMVETKFLLQQYSYIQP